MIIVVVTRRYLGEPSEVLSLSRALHELSRFRLLMHVEVTC